MGAVSVALMASASQAAADEAEVETKKLDWGTVTVTKNPKVGEDVVVTLTLADGLVTEPTMLMVDMHWFKGANRAGVAGRFGAPKKLKAGETGPFTFKKEVPDKDGISAIAAVVTLSPDGSWDKKTHTTSVGVRVLPADKQATPATQNATAGPAADEAQATPAAAAPATGPTRLFVLSGQSNMVGLNPDDTFVPRLKEAFPDQRIVVVKDAENGQAINRWHRDKGKGDLYLRLMKHVKETAGEQAFVSTTFVWIQGESDAMTGKSGEYENHLRGLIDLLRRDLKAPAMTVVIGRISDHKNGDEQWDAVRAIQVKIADADALAGWVDTDDLNGDDNSLHYRNKTDRAELGKRLASKAAELIRKSDE